jgi:hypothetical protein
MNGTFYLEIILGNFVFAELSNINIQLLNSLNGSNFPPCEKGKWIVTIGNGTLIADVCYQPRK